MHPGQRGIWAWHAIAIEVVGHDREAINKASQLLELSRGEGRTGPFPARHRGWDSQDKLLQRTLGRLSHLFGCVTEASLSRLSCLHGRT